MIFPEIGHIVSYFVFLQYVGLMPHPVFKPYHWDDSVETFYKRIDDEHKVSGMHTISNVHTDTLQGSALPWSDLFEKFFFSGAV